IVRIWRKQNENMDPSCLVTTVQAGGGGVMVWGMFSWHTLGPLVPIGHHLNATAYLSIENVRPSVRQLKLKRSWALQQDNDPKQTIDISITKHRLCNLYVIAHEFPQHNKL
uniref:Uncharacterized protein n=1 Tax=Xenopus tropicalis TaxID=8364 RepID=A0A803JC28_XENTR